MIIIFSNYFVSVTNEYQDRHNARSRSRRFSTLHWTALGRGSVTLVTNIPRGLNPITDKRFILTPERPDRLWGPPRFYRLRTECCFYGRKRPELQAYSRQSNVEFRTERTYTCTTSHTAIVCSKTPPSMYWLVLWTVSLYYKTCDVKSVGNCNESKRGLA